MYRCIWISEEQQQLQKIIWRDSPCDKLHEFQLCTITYGMKCAPWLAMRTLKQLALDDGHKYPDAAEVLKNEFYVDDLVSGQTDLKAALMLQQSLISLLKGGGMNLRKWSANHPDLLKTLKEDQICSQGTFDFKHEETKKTLRLSWNPITDTFTFDWNIQKKESSPITKRKLLSALSQLYDPLGWLSPIVIKAKLLFQRVWMCKLGWDEALPEEIQQEWLKLETELPLVKSIKLRRWLGTSKQTIQLVCFCDASEKAYSCVIYTRVPNDEGNYSFNLLVAKTRVAPLAQKLTLPRLELCGALLLSQLIEKIKETYVGYEFTIQAWSDSQVVLAWLQGDSSRWERYVTNRVNKIKQVISPRNWHYVKSEHNPADCASRGMYPSKLIPFKLWWNGPDFLQTLQEESTYNSTCYHTTEAERKTLPETTLAKNQDDNIINNLLNNTSSLNRVIRITAWLRRFSTHARNRTKLDTYHLTTCELIAAKECIIKLVQQMEFENEYKRLYKQNFISNKSSIYRLNPFLDKKGIIRVGGRLNKSTLPSGMKNPIIIPKRCRLTELVIDEAHSVTLHGGARLTLSYIRQRYWIVGGNRVVKAQLRHCVKCCRYKTTQHHQIMADLPPQRITPSRPFTHAGVDFTGHVEVKLNKGRGVKSSKGYIAIFVCMATKAVHIELVSDLSTETFLAAFHRMCARRGTPKHMYSDCGTNFIGTSKRLRREFEDFKLALSPAFFNEIGKMEVEWHFNAPAWPNAGGLWEAAVKSMKHHLHRVLGDQRLTYEEFSTLLAKIEGCMNSRPLCPLTEDPEEFYNYLTPGHFMTGGPILTVPCADYCDVNKIDLRRRYHLTEHMLQQFWKRWANDYLTTLQVRSKWNTPTANIKEGDIVLVKENNLPPGKWALGRVTQLHPGSDGYVRVTTLKTQNGTIKRPVVKLSPLPVQNHSELNKETLQTDEQTKPAKLLTKNCFNTLFSTLLTMFIVVTGARAQASGHSDMTPGARITNIDADRPLYYDAMGKIQLLHDEWILLMYYNLTNYWDGIQHMQSYLNGINDLCERTDPRYCKTTLEQLYHEMDLINYYNSILLTPHKHLTERRKRGLINGVGSIANSLFGLLDQNFADKYSNDIDSIQRNEKHLMELIKNQTSVVELQTNILKMTEENIKKQFNSLDYFINQTEANIAKLESQLAVVMASSYFSSASLASFLLINNLKKMQELFFNTLTDVYRGHIDVHLITPANLIEQINDISGKLPKSLAWPIENIREDLKNLYKLMYVKARVTRNFFLFEIHIPLVSDDEFKLHRVFALPISTNTGRVVMQLSSEYIAVNFERSTYTTLREGDINSCIQIKVDNFICNKNLPIFDLHNNKAPCEAKLLGHRTLPSCELKTTLCKDEWIQLHAPNSWLTICCGVCTLRMICENDMTSHTMNQSGIITLSQGCVLQSDHAMIHSHNQYRSDIKLNSSFMTPSLMSPINNLVHIKHYNLSHIKLTDDSMLMELNTSLWSLRAQEDHFPETITTHDIHQYVICYGLLGIAIIVIIVWAVKKCKTATCLNLRWKRTPKNKSVYEDIELQTISKRLESHQEKLKNNPSSSLEQRIERPGRRNASGADNIAFDFD